MAYFYKWNKEDGEKITFEDLKNTLGKLRGTGEKIYVGINAKRKMQHGRWLKIKTAGRNMKRQNGIMKEVPSDKVVYAVVEEGNEEYLTDVEQICGGYEKFKELMELARRQHEFFFQRDIENRQKLTKAIEEFPLIVPKIMKRKTREESSL